MIKYAPGYKEGYIPTEHGLRLFYRQVGDGNQVVVAPSGSWLRDDIGPLFSSQRTWIFFDTRGSGASDTVTDASQVEADFEIRDLEAVRRFFSIDRMALFGWSMYGAIAARYAARFPEHVARMVMMCPGYIRSEAPYLDMAVIRQKVDARIDPAALERLEQLKREGFDLSQPEAYCREHQRVYLVRQMGKPTALDDMRSNPCANENVWPRNMIAFIQKLTPPGAHDWRTVAATIQSPTLVIHGSEDLIPVESSVEWAGTIPDAELVVITSSGHYPHLEAPDTLFAAIDKFLNN